jgi:hypothetical protein
VDDNILTNGKFAQVITTTIQDRTLISRFNTRELAAIQAILGVIAKDIDIELKKRAKRVVRIIK